MYFLGKSSVPLGTSEISLRYPYGFADEAQEYRISQDISGTEVALQYVWGTLGTSFRYFRYSLGHRRGTSGVTLGYIWGTSVLPLGHLFCITTSVGNSGVLLWSWHWANRSFVYINTNEKQEDHDGLI